MFISFWSTVGANFPKGLGTSKAPLQHLYDTRDIRGPARSIDINVPWTCEKTETEIRWIKDVEKHFFQKRNHQQCSLLGAPGRTTRNKDATRGSWPRY